MKNSYFYLTCLGLSLSGIGSAARAQTAFLATSVVVVRVGDGSAALTSDATPVFLDEYSPLTGAKVQSIALPTATSGPNNVLTVSGSATSEGTLNRSADGRYLLLTGYSAVPGTAVVTGTTASAVPRVVARVPASGVVNTSTLISDAFSAFNVRGAASAGGSALYVIGSGSGVRLVPFGNPASAASTSVSSGTPTNLRAITLAGGSLYVSSASGGALVYQLGTGGLPTTAQPLVVLPNFPTNTGGSPYGMTFFDLTPTVPGPDVLYVADDALGIQKWSLVGTSWAYNGLIAGVGLRQLTGTNQAGTVSLVISAANGLYAVADATGYNAAPTATLPTAPLVAAPINTAFRGVALAPLAPALAARPATVANAALSLYPNPVAADEVLTVRLAPAATLAGTPAELLDALGRVVVAAPLPVSGELRLPRGLAPGLYVLRVAGLSQRVIVR